MARCRPSIGTFIGGALLGAAIAFVLVPNSRRILKRTARRWLYELQRGDADESADVEDEAGATEGGLAATRGWTA